MADVKEFFVITYDASTGTVAYSGDADAAGVIRVKQLGSTQILLMLWTVNNPPAVAPATLNAVTWPNGQPTFMTSEDQAGRLPAGQVNPVWVITDNFTDPRTQAGSTAVELDILYNAKLSINDPTIVNVDPG